MLTISYGEKTTDSLGCPKIKCETVEWKCGQPQPTVPVFAAKVVVVQASQEELECIRRRFTNLPMLDRILPDSTVSWIGDDARFIVANLVD